MNKNQSEMEIIALYQETDKKIKEVNKKMKVSVNQNECISCALCVDQCPSVFRFNSDNKSEAIKSEVDDNHSEDVKMAAYECPTSAIKLN